MEILSVGSEWAHGSQPTADGEKKYDEEVN
jgi:hypothetical protein